MAREHQARLQLLHLLQALEIALVAVLAGEERIDSGRGDGKHVIATEQDARIGIEEHERIGGMPRHLEDLERAIPDCDGITFLNRVDIKTLLVDEDRFAVAGFVRLRHQQGSHPSPACGGRRAHRSRKRSAHVCSRTRSVIRKWAYLAPRCCSPDQNGRSVDASRRA